MFSFRGKIWEHLQPGQRSPTLKFINGAKKDTDVA
jgi:hypothetical protein